MRAFDSVDLEKSVIDLNLEKDIPTQRSLGLLWDLQADKFKFEISPEIKLQHVEVCYLQLAVFRIR